MHGCAWCFPRVTCLRFPSAAINALLDLMPSKPEHCCTLSAAGSATDLSNELVTCQQYSGPLAAQLEEANSHLATCEADLQHCLANNLAVASGR